VRPQIVIHSDWSIDSRKRWMCQANLDSGRYVVATPCPVMADRFVDAAIASARDGGAVLGFDFPIGLPRAYAARAGIERFLDVLPQLGHERWDRFYDPATSADEVAIERPFYPYRPGGTARKHLLDGLGIESPSDLLRRCEFGFGRRRDACSLFWTLGGNQVGKAAIAGWKEILAPAFRTMRQEVSFWPFDGTLTSLVDSTPCVIAETYPADACVQIGLPFPGTGWSKRIREDRCRQSSRLIEWANGKPVDLEAVQLLIESGFDAGPYGEDQFDAVVGLFGMLDVLLGYRHDGRPDDAFVDAIEGWILGQAAAVPTN
jgi:hypothetical protein